MIYLQLCYEFFKIGLFAFGGGLATLPFLKHLSEATGWYSMSLITDMIAISESTPGPIGINMATYVGYNVGGIFGGVVATISEIIPAILIVTAVSQFLDKFKENKMVQDAFYGLRPAVTGLIAAAGFEVVKLSILQIERFSETHQLVNLFDWRKLVFFVGIFYLIKRFDKHPVVYIAFAALVGIVLQF